MVMDRPRILRGITARDAWKGFLATTFLRISFLEFLSPSRWPHGPQDSFWTWAAEEPETEVLQIIPNCRRFKINVF